MRRLVFAAVVAAQVVITGLAVSTWGEVAALLLPGFVLSWVMTDELLTRLRASAWTHGAEGAREGADVGDADDLTHSGPQPNGSSC